MGFQYQKNKESHSSDSMWTSYSDLFLGLSIIFLLLYVAASLRQGTDGIRQFLENKQLVKETQDLRQQIKVYNNLKQNYMDKEASDSEKEAYQALMSKLDLLQEESKDEKIKLRNQALENENKEKALNQYQQMIRNIINSNVIAKGRIKNRDVLIDTKEEIIGEKDEEISGLEKTVAQKKSQLAQGEKKIETLEDQLNNRLKQLKSAYKNQKLTKKKFEAEQTNLRREIDQKIQNLKSQNSKVAQDLAKTSQELQKTAQDLNQTKSQVAKLGQEKSALKDELTGTQAKYQQEMESLKGQFAKQKEKERAQFESALQKEKLSAAEKVKREAQFRSEAQRRERELGEKVAALDKKYQGSQKDLAKATERLNAQRKLADQIKKNFSANGVDADVDPESGDVVLSFGDQYFDTGKATLKNEMKKILEQAMPVYSASLFENQKVAEKIQSVEIVGFASPTYKGKYIDPSSLEAGDRQAVNYNLDLSYSRARSIFQHVFDKMKFKNQQQLQPLVKVTGRSFLSHEKNKNFQAAGKGEAFCMKNDCAKLQRVIIKFTLKD